VEHFGISPILTMIGYIKLGPSQKVDIVDRVKEMQDNLEISIAMVRYGF